MTRNSICFYKYQLTDKINYILTSSSSQLRIQNAGNEDIVIIGTLGTTFTFSYRQKQE